MSSIAPVSLYPVAIVEDRYGGTYSSGAWWAVARANERREGFSRVDWLMAEGPGGDDITAAIFWGKPPPWIAAAPTPDQALANLLGQSAADDGDWTPPPLEDDPRYGS